MTLSRVLFLSFFLVQSLLLNAQKTDSTTEFLFPINPGVQGFLSGTMGELRPNHFHGGIDIKTGGVTGLPVYAAADGHISRVKQSSFGYGNLIYITHANGYITTYAHLETFGEPLGTHILKEQYKRQVFDLELFFDDSKKFPVNRGQIIGYSGNTGGSGGPHLHFEIRDEKGNLLNPLLFKFTEVIDTTPPTFVAMAARPLTIDARVAKRFERQEYKAVKQGNHYVITDTVKAFGNIGFSIDAFDRLDMAANKNGIMALSMTVNGKPWYAFSLEKVPFDRSRHILRHTDFHAWKRTGKFFQNCYLEDGNALDIYTANARKGQLPVSADSVYKIVFTASDAYGNKTTLQATVKGQKAQYTNTRAPKPLKPAITYEVAENILKITATDTSRTALNSELFVKRTKFDLLPSYTHQGRTTYLYDLRAGLPDSLRFCGRSLHFTFQQVVPSQTDFSFFHPEADLIFPANCLFDTLYLTASRSKDVWEFNDLYVPVTKHYSLTLKNTGPVSRPDRAAAYALGSGSMNANEGGKWNGDQITFQTRNFGKFTIKADTIPPTIKIVNRSPARISFKIRDNLSGIQSWRAELNGEWLLMKYEHKEALIYSEKLEKSKPLKGKFVLKVKDAAGNEAEYTTTLL